METYTYSNNRLVSTTGGEEISYRYNPDGDVRYLTEGGLEYELRYNRLHQLTGYLTSAGDAIAQYDYDGDGQRITKTVNGKTTLYHYGKGGELLSETDEAGNPQGDCIYLHGKLALKVAPDGVFFYHVDPAGTPLAMTDSTGAVTWRAEYKPFGEEQEITGPSENDKRFVGKEKDEESGLHYFGARYMESRIGRFMSPDPVGAVDEKTGKVNQKTIVNPQGLNRYTYGINNPYKYQDRDGKWPEDIHNRIIDRAFQNLPENSRMALERGSAYVDKDQSTEGSYKHAMRAPSQSPEEAERFMNTFINQKIKEYKLLISQGRIEEAHFALGEAMHPLMDSTSSSHEKQQAWRWSEGVKHYLAEREISPAKLDESVETLRRFYEKNR